MLSRGRMLSLAAHCIGQAPYAAAFLLQPHYFWAHLAWLVPWSVACSIFATYARRRVAKEPSWWGVEAGTEIAHGFALPLVMLLFLWAPLAVGNLP